MSSNLGRHDHDTVEKSSICTLRALTVHENKKQRSQIVPLFLLLSLINTLPSYLSKTNI